MGSPRIYRSTPVRLTILRLVFFGQQRPCRLLRRHSVPPPPDPLRVAFDAADTFPFRRISNNLAAILESTKVEAMVSLNCMHSTLVS